MKGLESYPRSRLILSLNPPSDSKTHAPSALNITSDIRTIFSQFFRNPRSKNRLFLQSPIKHVTLLGERIGENFSREKFSGVKFNQF